MFVREIMWHSVGRRARAGCQAGGLQGLCTSSYGIDQLMKMGKAKLPCLYPDTHIRVNRIIHLFPRFAIKVYDFLQSLLSLSNRPCVL